MIFIERYPLKRCQGCVKLIASKVNCFLNITDLSEVQLCMSSNSWTWECPHTKDGADHVPLIVLSNVHPERFLVLCTPGIFICSEMQKMLLQSVVKSYPVKLPDVNRDRSKLLTEMKYMSISLNGIWEVCKCQEIKDTLEGDLRWPIWQDHYRYFNVRRPFSINLMSND